MAAGGDHTAWVSADALERGALIALLAAAAISCTVTDGDTLRCGAERVRLTGIDAPELAGHCRKGRQCAPGDGKASKANLARIIGGRPVTLLRLGTDHYGRTLAVAYVGGQNIACAQLRDHQAIYRRSWDNGFRVAFDCWLRRHFRG